MCNAFTLKLDQAHMANRILKRRREVQLGVDQPGRRVRNEFDSRRVKNTRPFLKIPDKPGLLVTHKTTQPAAMNFSETSLQC
jgi:hypothetical protein